MSFLNFQVENLSNLKTIQGFVEDSCPHYMYCCLRSRQTQVYIEKDPSYLLRHNAAKSDEIQQTFRKNMSPPSSGLKSKSNKKQAQILKGSDDFVHM
jgi:hypothetical protein